MSQQPTVDPATAVGAVHKFGGASESLFRRLYHALQGRDDLRSAWQEQNAQLQAQAERNAALQRQKRGLQRSLDKGASEIERLNALLNSVSEGLILQDLNGKVTLMNGAAHAMLGGKRNFWQSELASLFERFRGLSDMRSDLMPLGESAELQLNDRVLRAQLAAIGGDDKQRIGTLIILRDVTFDALAQRMKDGAISALARDMAAPLSVVKLAGELLQGDAADKSLNRQLLGNLLANADLVDQLGLELLDIADAAAGSFDVTREPVAIEDLVWHVADAMQAELQERGVDLLLMTRGIKSARTLGDSARLQWALSHLLRNGAQYNQPGGYVALAARIAPPGDEPRIVIRVSDDGSGISADELPHIFERLYRGKNASEATPGLGQGLTVARAICQAHRGELGVESRLHIGSAFTMRLPLMP